MRTWSGAVAVALCVLAACKKEPRATPRLYEDAELDAMAGGLDALIAANQTRVCNRPVLRGAPAAGPAGADLLALTEPTGALAACATLLRDQGTVASDHLKTPLGTALPAELAGVTERCAELGAAIAKATQHEDACSPYLIGVRPDGVLLPPIALAKAAAILARELARAGKPVDAMTLLLDTARFAQDLGRDGTLIAAMVGTAMVGVADRAAAQVLRADLPLTAAELDAIDRELVVLIESEPHPRTLVEAEVASQRLNLALPLLKPEGWAPPGGWPPDRDAPTKDEMGGVHPRDYAGVIWEVAERSSAPLLAGCGAGTTVDACLTAIAATKDLRAGDPLELEDLERAVQEGRAASAIRAQIVDTLASVARTGYADMLGKYAGRTVGLIRLRAQIAVRELLLAEADCAAVEAAKLEVAPPAWMPRPRTSPGEAPDHDLQLVCPLAPLVK